MERKCSIKECPKLSTSINDAEMLDEPKDLEKLSENPTEAEIEEVKQKLFHEYADVFTEYETKLNPTACDPSEVELLPEANPIRVSTGRKIAYAYRDETKKELDKMADQGIIVPVGDVATEWCCAMVVVEKSNGGITICMDITKLNKYIKRPTYPGPAPREVVCDIPPNQKTYRGCGTKFDQRPF